MSYLSSHAIEFGTFCIAVAALFVSLFALKQSKDANLIAKESNDITRESNRSQNMQNKETLRREIVERAIETFGKGQQSYGHLFQLATAWERHGNTVFVESELQEMWQDVLLAKKGLRDGTSIFTLLSTHVPGFKK